MSEETTRITFVRHGQSESNLAQRWQGQGDSPLSALGLEQAKLVGARLARRAFSRVISSDLRRAAETARATGFQFETAPAFREFDIGSWEGLTREEVAAQFPAELERLKQGEDIPLGGGESYAAFSVRIDGALHALRAELAPGDDALVVCHGGVIATVLSGLLGLRDTRSWSFARVANTSITELSFSERGTLLHVFNDTLHLLPLGAWPAHPDVQAVVGLVCGVLAEQTFGAFAAHYDAGETLSALGPEPTAEACAGLLKTTLADLQARHPEQRVALSAHGHSIQALAEHSLQRGRSGDGTLAPPRAGSISHVGRFGDRLLLLDYGLME